MVTQQPHLCLEHERRIDKHQLEDLATRNGNCKNSFAFSLKTHIESGAEEIVVTPHICAERNCVTCFDNRVSKFKRTQFEILGQKISHTKLWKNLKRGIRVSHLYLTFSKIPRERMADELPALRHKIQRFERKLRNHPKYNTWGYGTFEYKYKERERCYQPHAHMICFGSTPSPKWIQDTWTDINGKYQKSEIEFQEKRQRSQSIDQYHEYLERRKMGMLDYFARRCVGAGLVFENVPDATGKPVDTIMGSMPSLDYLTFVKGSRLWFSFGEQHIYTFMGKIVKTNIPKGFLHSWEYRDRETNDQDEEYSLIHLGTLTKDQLSLSGGSPPPPSMDVVRFNQVVASMGRFFEDHMFSHKKLCRLAFMEYWGIARER